MKHESCCSTPDITDDGGKRVCKNCGSVQGYNIADEFVDFHADRTRMVRRSVYHRKYHILNKIDDVCHSFGLQITFNDKTKICRIFNEIDKIVPRINGERKRMININFILKRIFKMLKLPSENIPPTKSKRTLAFHKQYWKNIMLLKGDEIKSIVG